MLNQVLGIYELLKEIGSGGFGTVYLACRQTTNQIVAVKVLSLEFSSQPNFVESFWREAHALRDLPEHPNIIALHDYGDAQGQFYLVMDYLSGQDLRQTLSEKGVLSVRSALHVAAQVADALHTAADHGIIHCDIKPENIRVLAQDIAKVMDFGIARAIDAQSREVAGTPAYMAPEIWNGELPGPPSDIYALGCTLYEMLVGRPPFSVRSDLARDVARREWAQQHRLAVADLQPFDGVQVPPAFLALLAAMLDKRSSARPTADIVAQQLRVMVAETPEGARLELSAVQTAIDTDETQPHPVEDDEGRTRMRSVSSAPITPTGTPEVLTLPRIGADAQVVLQRHLASLDMEQEACGAQLVHQGALFTGTLQGYVWRLDLRTGRSQRWRIFQPGEVVSKAWSFVGHAERILSHAGGSTWVEFEAASGAVIRRGELPDRGMVLTASGGWLYGFGAGRQLHRAALRDMIWRDRFPMTGAIAGPPLVFPGGALVPTGKGLMFVDTQGEQVVRVGPEARARAIAPLSNRRAVALYPTVGEDGAQVNCIRLLDWSTLPPTFLAEAQAPGQNIGPLQSGGDRVFLTCRDGTVNAWDAAREDRAWSLCPAWQAPAQVGRALQAGAALGNGLLAMVAGKDEQANLVGLNAGTGRISMETPLNGGVYVSPTWSENALCVLLAKGMIEVFRVSLVQER